MTQSFDEWFEKQGMADCYGKSSEEYKASLFVWTRQQAEIDELQKEIYSYKCIYGKLELERDELRKRIENQVENLKLASKSWVYTEREQNIMISQADDLEKILKGTINEL